MFLKRCTRKKDGKPHTYRQLVESYRTARGPRHRVVAYLGELDKSERREKEKAIHERFAKRIEAGLGQLDRDLKQARKKRYRTVLERRIGRLLGRNSRAAGGFKIIYN